jgi:hypothetical protein
MLNKNTLLPALFALMGFAMSAHAGNLDSPAAPTDAGSAMYTGDDLYNRLITGAAGSKRSGPFAEPAAGPTASTGRTLDEIMAAMPTADNVNGATNRCDTRRHTRQRRRNHRPRRLK